MEDTGSVAENLQDFLNSVDTFRAVAKRLGLL
jgi:hypothetical protein